MSAEDIRLLIKAREEIISLQRTNERLSLKAEAYDALVTALRQVSRPGQAYGEDVAWRISERLSRLDEALADAPESET